MQIFETATTAVNLSLCEQALVMMSCTEINACTVHYTVSETMVNRMATLKITNIWNILSKFNLISLFYNKLKLWMKQKLGDCEIQSMVVCI